MESTDKNINALYEDLLKFQDVTSLFHEVCEGLELGEMIHSTEFNLHDSMSSSELCDAKMDLKVGYKDVEHPSQQITKGTIKSAEQLSNTETMAILDLIFAQEFLWLKGFSLSQSLYKTVYFYDEASYKPSPVMKSYIESVFLCGAIMFDTLRFSPYLREDDYIVTVFGFPKTQGEQEMVNNLTEAEKTLEALVSNPNTRKKKNLRMNEFDGIDARLKYRKAFLKLLGLMSNSNLTPAVEEQLQIQINICKKRLEEIKQTHEDYLGAACKEQPSILPKIQETYFQKDLCKTLNCLISPRPVIEVSVTEGFTMADNFFAQLEEIISLSKEKDFNVIIERIKDFNAMPKNILSKAYLDINIFYTSQKYFSQLPIEELVKGIFRDYGLKDSHFATDGWKEYSPQCCIVIQEYLAKYLRNPYRQYRDFSKLYQDLSVLVSSSDKFEKENLVKKEESKIATEWCYNLACKMMANQLHLGIQMDLFDQADYSQIFFALEFIYNIIEVNSQTYMLKVDKSLMQGFYLKQNVDLLKKKLKPFQRKMFNQFVFCKGMQLYCKATTRLCFLLEKLGLANEYNDDETKRNRYANRFKIFEGVFYLKFQTYDQFCVNVQEVCKDVKNETELGEGLLQVKEIYTQAQQLFQKLPADDDSIHPRMKAEAAKLVRICVMSSMTALKIKMKIGKLAGLKAVYKNAEHPWYPNIDVV